MKNHEEITQILKNAETAMEQLTQVCNLYRNIYDIYTPKGRQKINQFEEVFKKRYENVMRSLNSLKKHIEESFAPSEEEVLQEKALKAVQEENPTFDSWPIEAKNAILSAKLKELSENLKNRTTIKRPGSGKLQTVKNPDLYKPFSITSDLTGSRPYQFILQEKVYLADSWKNICAKICDILYNQNTHPLDDFILENSNAGIIDGFSIQSTDFARPLEMVKGIFINGQRDFIYYKRIIITLLEIYQIPTEALSIYLSKIPKR